MKKCMWFWYNTLIIFSHFFCFVNLVSFFTWNAIKVYRQWVPCGCNSSYSFALIVLKLCRCFLHGMKMCMRFWYNPWIFFSLSFQFSVTNLSFSSDSTIVRSSDSSSYYMSCLMTKPTKWSVRPTKTQISLGICPVWSESSLSKWRNIGPSATHWAHYKDSDQTGQSFCWFCHEAAHFNGDLILDWFCSFHVLLIEPHHEKTSLYYLHSLISAFVVHCLDGKIPMLSILKIPRL